ncbi:MAG: hypothetical protein ACPG5B_17030 [Chitinophagales bacterium]
MFCFNTAIYYACITSFDGHTLEFCTHLDGEAEEKEQEKEEKKGEEEKDSKIKLNLFASKLNTLNFLLGLSHSENYASIHALEIPTPPPEIPVFIS